MGFNENLKLLRKQNNMTQDQLAEKLFVSRAAVSKWESGRGYPNIDSLKAITKLFNITLDALLSSEEVLDLAKANSSADIKKIELKVFGILDIMCIALLFLPIFAQSNGQIIVCVPLIFCTTLPLWISILYFLLIGLVSVIGIGEIITAYLSTKKYSTLLQSLSFIICSILILLLIANQQPYPAAYSFCLMLAKIFIIAKTYRKKG